MQYLGSHIVGASSLLGSLKVAEKPCSPRYLNASPPVSISDEATNPLESSLIAKGGSAIALILRAGGNSDIAPTIVEPITVYMVNVPFIENAKNSPVHSDLLGASCGTFFRCSPTNRVPSAFLGMIPQSIPSAIRDGAINIVDEGDFALAEWYGDHVETSSKGFDHGAGHCPGDAASFTYSTRRA